MSALAKNASLGVWQRGAVECGKCRTPIHVQRPNTVALEFSVPCERCGYRGFYFKRMLYIEDVSERRTKPRH